MMPTLTACLAILQRSGLLIALVSALVVGGRMASAAAVTPETEFVLNTRCPASFTENAEGGCVLNNRYRQYRSLQNKGVGGLKTGLPPLREGFTPAQIDLGRYLFFDPILSLDGTISCASCHDPALAFSDGQAQAVGIGGQTLLRSAPSLWNVGFLSTLLWDGAQSTLESQMQGPLYSPLEMGNNPANLLATLNNSNAYQNLFAQAFGQSAVTLEDVYTAITAFESSLISLNSRYDLYAGAQAITGDESQRGAFRVPSLRNVVRTAPYMHRGQKGTLADAARFYTGGRGHEVPEGDSLMIHWHIWEPNLTEREIDLLTGFMGTLTDEAFMPAIPHQVPSGLPVTRAKKAPRAPADTLVHNITKPALQQYQSPQVNEPSGGNNP